MFCAQTKVTHFATMNASFTIKESHTQDDAPEMVMQDDCQISALFAKAQMRPQFQLELDDWCLEIYTRYEERGEIGSAPLLKV